MARSKIADLRDLIGCRVGTREYSMTAARGALRDHFGIEAEQFHICSY
jgi:hypothetical protein